MAAPYRSTCTIDGQKFDCLSVSVSFNTDKDRAGMPQMGSLSTTMRVYVDKVKPIKLEFWKDDSHQDALATYSFNGWISGYHTLNPYQSDEQLEDQNHSGVNHVLVLDLEAAMNQQNFSDISLSN